MIRNYLKIAWRMLRKNKVFSIVNVLGLTVGVSCFLLIVLYIFDEWSYDRYNTKAGEIYRVDHHIKFGDFVYDGAESPAALGPAFARDFPQVLQYVRLRSGGGIRVTKGTERFQEERTAYADSTLFSVFTIPLLEGNAKTALSDPHAIAISSSTANKYFGTTKAVGNILHINEGEPYQVTAVFEDMPDQSHFHFDFLFSMAATDQSRDANWLNNNFHTYLLLRPGTDVKALEKQMLARLNEYSAPFLEPTLNMTPQAFAKAGNYLKSSLMPLTKIHLHGHGKDEFEANGNIRWIYIFAAIALFILAIACINFMNLSTAHSANRAKEVGLRKVFGGSRANLRWQFLAESILLCGISFLLALFTISILMPYFNMLSGKQLHMEALLGFRNLTVLMALVIVVGLLAGSYPAFFLSRFRPAEVLKGKLATGFKGQRLRNGLVVFQFSISLVLIISTIVIYQQLYFVRHKNLGFNKDQVLVLHNAWYLGDQGKAFMNEMRKLPGVDDITMTGYIPITGARSSRGILTSPVFNGKDFNLMQQWTVDADYIPTFRIQLAMGRNFSPFMPSDSGAVIINEAAARVLGLDNPLQKKIYRIQNIKSGELTPLTVIGVIRNFNFNSLHEQVSPLLLTLGADFGSMAIRIKGDHIPALLDRVTASWKAMVPATPISYAFLDDQFEKQYLTEERTGSLAALFSGLAIFIACMGLFGLVTFAAEQRVKEIGIRKVLGAAISDILLLLSKDYLKLIFLALAISIPVSVWMMQRWLQDFAYRIQISWWVFAVAGFVVILVAMFTAGLRTVRAARSNPVNSLRAD